MSWPLTFMFSYKRYNFPVITKLIYPLLSCVLLLHVFISCLLSLIIPLSLVLFTGSSFLLSSLFTGVVVFTSFESNSAYKSFVILFDIDVNASLQLTNISLTAFSIAHAITTTKLFRPSSLRGVNPFTSIHKNTKATSVFLITLELNKSNINCLPTISFICPPLYYLKYKLFHIFFQCFLYPTLFRIIIIHLTSSILLKYL